MSLHRQLISYRYPARRGARSVKVGTSRRRLPPCVVSDCLQTACKMPPSLLADATFLFWNQREPARIANRIHSNSESAPASRPAKKMHSARGGVPSNYFFWYSIRFGVASLKANPCAAIASSARGSLARTEAVWSEPLPESIKMPRASPAASPWGPKAPSLRFGTRRRAEFYLSSP
jgi:hypothetical protein